MAASEKSHQTAFNYPIEGQNQDEKLHTVSHNSGNVSYKTIWPGLPLVELPQVPPAVKRAACHGTQETQKKKRAPTTFPNQPTWA